MIRVMFCLKIISTKILLLKTKRHREKTLSRKPNILKLTVSMMKFSKILKTIRINAQFSSIRLSFASISISNSNIKKTSNKHLKSTQLMKKLIFISLKLNHCQSVNPQPVKNTKISEKKSSKMHFFHSNRKKILMNSWISIKATWRVILSIGTKL